jgi:hypothetical protein
MFRITRHVIAVFCVLCIGLAAKISRAEVLNLEESGKPYVLEISGNKIVGGFAQGKNVWKVTGGAFVDGRYLVWTMARSEVSSCQDVETVFAKITRTSVEGIYEVSGCGNTFPSTRIWNRK